MFQAHNDGHIIVTHDATDASLKDVPVDWSSSNRENRKQISMKVRRQFVWQDVLLQLDRIKEDSLNKYIKVQFENFFRSC